MLKVLFESAFTEDDIEFDPLGLGWAYYQTVLVLLLFLLFCIVLSHDDHVM